jgi:hypothetical protein
VRRTGKRRLSRTLDDPGVSPGKTMLVSQGFSVSPAEQRDVIIKSEGDPDPTARFLQRHLAPACNGVDGPSVCLAKLGTINDLIDNEYW